MKNNLKNSKQDSKEQLGIAAYLDKDILEKLKKDSKYKKIKLNVYANKLLRDSLFEKKIKKGSDLQNKIMVCPECYFEGKMLTTKEFKKKGKSLKKSEGFFSKIFRKFKN